MAAAKKTTKAKAAPAAVAAPVAVKARPTSIVQKTHSFRRKLIGRVTSDKMDKTIVVEVERYSPDAMYKKYVKSREKYKAHDELNEYKTGDRVEIMEHRPISKEKRFKVVRLVSRPALDEKA